MLERTYYDLSGGAASTKAGFIRVRLISANGRGNRRVSCQHSKAFFGLASSGDESHKLTH